MGTPAQVRVGFPGEDFSFSAGAVAEYFKIPHVKTREIRPFKPVPCVTFDNTVESFHDGKVDEILVPIRNNNSRNVLPMQKMLRDVFGEVAGEVYYPVQQCALVNKGVTLDMITQAWSMGPAVEQTGDFIKGKKLTVVFKKDTALAAKELKKSGRRDVVAIASPEAGEFYKLDNLGCANDHDYSYTHFLHIVRKAHNKFFTPPIEREKECLTKIILYGELYPAEGTSPFQIFTKNKVKITNPIDADRNTFEHQTVILDLQGHLKSAAIRRCFTELDGIKTSTGQKMYKREIMGCFLSNPAPPRDRMLANRIPKLEWQ